MAEIKSIVAMLVQRHRLELAAHGRVDVTGPLLLTPKRSVQVVVQGKGHRNSRNEIRGTIRSYVEWPA
jgi:hypothetical protein